MKLMIIRPEPGASATATRVSAAGHQPLVMPLFEIQPVAWDAPDISSFDGLLFTSSNAVRQAGPALASFSNLPVYAVGKVTADAAVAAGFKVATFGDKGVDDLLDQIAHKKLLWLTGEDHIRIKAPPTMQVVMRIVYKSASLAAPANFAATLAEADYILLHSPRAATHLAALVAEQAIDQANISIATLSASIADTAGDGWARIKIASAPDDATLLSAL